MRGNIVARDVSFLLQVFDNPIMNKYDKSGDHPFAAEKYPYMVMLC